MLVDVNLVQEIIQDTRHSKVGISYAQVVGENLHYGMAWKYSEEMSIHTFANLCKVWAHDLGYITQSYPYNDGWRVDLLHGLDPEVIFKEKSEQEAIYKATVFVSKNRNGEIYETRNRKKKD